MRHAIGMLLTACAYVCVCVRSWLLDGGNRRGRLVLNVEGGRKEGVCEEKVGCFMRCVVGSRVDVAFKQALGVSSELAVFLFFRCCLFVVPLCV